VSPMLEVAGATKAFGGPPVLDDVSLTLDAGQTLALVGENGAGKSTLIRLLSGALRPDAGEIRLDGHPVDFHRPIDAQRAGIVTVHQEFNLFQSMSVAENLLLGTYPRRRGAIDWRAMRREAREFLASRRLELDVDRRVSTLSVAEKQMLEIAKALHRQVRILILDEPTAVLGGDDVDDLLKIVGSLRDDGLAVIFVSHRLDEVLAISDTYVVLKDGVKVAAGPIAETSHDDLVTKMVGRNLRLDEIREAAGAEAAAAGRELLRVEGLTRESDRPGKRVLDDVSLTLHAGEVVGIAGLRGAGRTELARAIFGADPIDAGTIYVDGEEVQISSPRDAVAHGIGLVPEERGTQGLLLNLSSAQNIPLVRMARQGGMVLRPDQERRLAWDYARRLKVRVADVAHSVRGLSGGNQQKIVLAKWLEAGVSILILDEPTRGVDVGAKHEIYRVVRDLCRQGMGVLLISSELPEVLAMSDRILVMHEGTITAEVDGPTATEEQLMNAAVGAVAS
jgi:ABC-type sugar transport system ATPase subunit